MNKITFNFNEKEEQVMKILWESDAPMSASEIASRIDSEWASKSIQNIIRKLEGKKAIEIAEIAKIGKTYGRLFKPSITVDEYVISQLNKLYADKEIPVVVSKLIESKSKNSELSKDLKSLMEKYKGE